MTLRRGFQVLTASTHITQSSWHPIKRIKSTFDSKPFLPAPIHLPFDFDFSCQDLNNLQHTDWHGSLQLKDKCWRGEISFCSSQQACFKQNHYIDSLFQQHSCKLLSVQAGRYNWCVMLKPAKL